MTYRLTTLAGERAHTIRVEGQLTTDAVPDLEWEVARFSWPVELDLSGLVSADADGLQELRSLSARGAKLSGASPYIRQLLDAT